MNKQETKNVEMQKKKKAIKIWHWTEKQILNMDSKTQIQITGHETILKKMNFNS